MGSANNLSVVRVVTTVLYLKCNVEFPVLHVSGVDMAVLQSFISADPEEG